MTESEKNLLAAFAGESQANRRYLAFAKKAEREGHTKVAHLFRAAAEAETIHAHAHLRALKAIGSTAENLQEAVSGETHEFTEMYPGMIETAKKEGNKAAEVAFTFANEVEKIHAGLFQQALAALAGAEADVDYHVCGVCGYTGEGAIPEKCPVCGANSKAFSTVA